MVSKTVLADVKGFTPLMDILVSQYQGIITAAVFGRVWRYCQGPYGACSASLQKIANELGISYATVIRHIKALCADGYLEDTTPNLKNRPHIYLDTGKVRLQVLLKAGPSESKSALSESASTLSESKSHSIRKTDEDTIRDKPKEKENKDIELFESFTHQPVSEAPISEGHIPAVADPSVKLMDAIEEVARQLAPTIDWVWGSSEASDKSLLHAAEELLKQCGGDADGVLDALDAYLDNPKNREWAREEAQDPHWLLKSVAGQYQKNKGKAHRKATALDDWAEHAERSQQALAERQAERSVFAEEKDVWWKEKLEEMNGQMTDATFDAWLKGTTVSERGEVRVVIAVANEQAKEWLEHRLRPVIERTVMADGVTDVVFEVLP